MKKYEFDKYDGYFFESDVGDWIKFDEIIKTIKEIKSKLANDLDYTFEMAWLNIEELLEVLEK